MDIDKDIEDFLALPYEEQRGHIIASIRSLGKSLTNAAWRERVFNASPDLRDRIEADEEIQDWLSQCPYDPDWFEKRNRRHDGTR